MSKTFSETEEDKIMERCDYCAYRNSWECGDGWNRRYNYTFCDDFKLDFDTLTEKQKKAIQKTLMKDGEDEW